MIKADYHMHTTYSDGDNTPEEMVLKAIDLGLDEVGISDHSYVSFDPDYCMQPDATDSYKAEVAALREKYADQIKVLCGIEQDYYSDLRAEGFDYIIGSVHYLYLNGQYVSIDEYPEDVPSAADKYFGGDVLALCEEFYKTLADVVNKTGADIIGHFDLVSKYNEYNTLFDSNDPRYIKAWQTAADALIETGRPFEINTGAMSKGRRSEPYPSFAQIKYIKEKGGRFVLSSDAHNSENICFFFKAIYDKFDI